MKWFSAAWLTHVHVHVSVHTRHCNDQSADIVNPQFAELMSGVGRARLHAERRCTRGEQHSVSVTVTVLLNAPHTAVSATGSFYNRLRQHGKLRCSCLFEHFEFGVFSTADWAWTLYKLAEDAWFNLGFSREQQARARSVWLFGNSDDKFWP